MHPAKAARDRNLSPGSESQVATDIFDNDALTVEHGKPGGRTAVIQSTVVTRKRGPESGRRNQIERIFVGVVQANLPPVLQTG